VTPTQLRGRPLGDSGWRATLASSLGLGSRAARCIAARSRRLGDLSGGPNQSQCLDPRGLVPAFRGPGLVRGPPSNAPQALRERHIRRTSS
jgi:hypothetical protein